MSETIQPYEVIAKTLVQQRTRAREDLRGDPGGYEAVREGIDDEHLGK